MGTISVATSLLEESYYRGALSLSAKIDGRALEDILRAKLPNPSPPNPIYISNMSKKTIPYMPSFWNKPILVTSKKLQVHKLKSWAIRLRRYWIENNFFFKNASSYFFETIAKVAHRITTETNVPEHLEDFKACGLVPLGKNPGNCQLSIGGVLRKISAPRARQTYHKISSNSDPLSKFAQDKSAELISLTILTDTRLKRAILGYFSFWTRILL